MTLLCPHCRARSTHKQRDILGEWVVCRACTRYFAWRPANKAQVRATRRRAAQRIKGSDENHEA